MFGFVGNDGVYHHVRYRLLLQAFDGVESGAPDDFDHTHPWLQNPVADEPRTRNYLKDATRASIAAGQVLRYRLRLQLRLQPPAAQIQADCLSSAVPWDETVFPWRDLAEVELDEALSYQESMLTWFDPGNHPASLPVPKARSIDDPHSLNHLRLRRSGPTGHACCRTGSVACPRPSATRARTATGRASRRCRTRPERVLQRADLLGQQSAAAVLWRGDQIAIERASRQGSR